MAYHKIIIAGSRDFNNYELLKQTLDSELSWYSEYDGFEIVSGTARGADTLGERYAKENLIPLIKFPADWRMLGKRAGIIRNESMAKYSKGTDENYGILFAFWDGKSKGTNNMINIAKKYDMCIQVINYKECDCK